MHRVQWMLSMLAIVGCLWSVASIHSHDDGLHALESGCISCDFEDVVSHGTVVAIAQRSTSNLSQIKPVASQSALNVAAKATTAPIRAPPIIS
jgi:hypothetical protein